MKFDKTYKIKYASGLKSAWLGLGQTPDHYPDVTWVEEIPVVIADEGKSLWYNGQELGSFAMLGDLYKEWITERDIVIEDDPEETADE